MYLILVLLLLGSAHSDPDADKTVLIPEVEKLANILGPAALAHYPFFRADLTTESARRNILCDKYAQICYDAYVALKLSPEEELLMWKEVETFRSRNVSNTNQTPLSELMPVTHSVISTRRVAFKKLAEDGSPETKIFVKKIDSKLQSAIDSILAWEGLEDVFRTTTSQIAVLYKKLSTEAKHDLERSICLRNAIQWSNFTNPQYIQLADRFSEVVGLDVDRLIEECHKLSSYSILIMKRIFQDLANRIGMYSQDYVDTCADILAVVKVSRDDVRALRENDERAFGEEFGKNHYNTSTEMMEVFNAENALFFKMLSMGRKILHEKLHHLTQATQAIVQKAEKYVIELLFVQNNRLAANLTRKIELTGMIFNEVDSTVKREIEQVFCFEIVINAMG